MAVAGLGIWFAKSIHWIVCVIDTKTPCGRMFIWCFVIACAYHHHSIDRPTLVIFHVIKPKRSGPWQNYGRSTRTVLKKSSIDGAWRRLICSFAFDRGAFSGAALHPWGHCDTNRNRVRLVLLEPSFLRFCFKAIQTRMRSKRGIAGRRLVSCGDGGSCGRVCV